jgi:hypothetical protein
MFMTVTQNGSAFSGSTTVSGVQTRDDSCALIGTDSSDSGTVSGTISGSTLQFLFTINGSANMLNFKGTATLSNSTLVGSFVRDSGGAGSFTLTTSPQSKAIPEVMEARPAIRQARSTGIGN